MPSNETGRGDDLERSRTNLEGRPIDRGSSRALFAELMATALRVVDARPSPLAITYLIALLDDRLRAPGEDAGVTLAEALLTARRQAGAERVVRLRELGDRALFVSGFFGDSLSRSLVDLDYYREIGATAYDDLSSFLAIRRGDESWSGLYRELAERFGALVDVLAEIGDRARGDGDCNLLRIFDRYAATGSSRDRARLMRRGLAPSAPDVLRRWQ